MKERHIHIWGARMIVLRKSRILLIMILVFISVFTFTLSRDNINNKTIETVSLPVSGKVVVLDAGHGVPDERCRK